MVMRLFLIILCSLGGGVIFTQMPQKVIEQKVDEATWLMENQAYELSYNIWAELLNNVDSENANWNYKAGYCLLHSRYVKKEALRYLKKAVQRISTKYDPTLVIQKDAPPEALYYLGRAYHLAMEWDSAIYYFDKFRATVGMNHSLISEMNLYYQYCINGKELSMTYERVLNIQNLGESINSEYPDYTPVLTLDEKMIIFTSRRPRDNPANPNPIEEATGQYFEDIYYSYKNEKGQWERAILAPFCGNGHEAVVSLSPTGNILYIYRDDAGDGNLYYVYLTDTGFSSLYRMPFPINTKYYEGHITFSPDESQAIFTSDRPGGYGGRDLWIVKKLPDGEWSAVQNLGPVINTPYHEDAPFWHPSGKVLYFSSQGHKSIGGFDIFYSEMNDTGGWSKPINVGIPINTPDDDVFAYFSPDGSRVYFASTREDALGDKDIYVAEISIEVEQPVALLSGEIFFEGDSLPPGIKILVYDKITGSLVAESRPNKFTKRFVLPLAPGKYYVVQYLLNQDTLGKEEVYVPPGVSFQKIQKTLTLKGLYLSGLGKEAKEEGLSIEIKHPMFPKLLPQGIKFQIIDEKGNIVAQGIVPRTGNIFQKISPEILTKSKLIIISPIEGLIDCKEIYGEIKDANGNVIGKLLANENCEISMQIVERKGVVMSGPESHEEEKIIAEKTVASTSTEETEKIVLQKLGETKTKWISFTKYFRYNEVEIDTLDDTWSKFIQKIQERIRENREVLLYVEASASRVPTKTYFSNERLAQARGNEALNTLKRACLSSGIDFKKIRIVEFRTVVQGPPYEPGKPPQQYENYQYVKLSIR